MRVRLAGVELPENKRIDIALTYIYGIGRSLSEKILKKVRIDSNKKVKELGEGELKRLRDEVESGKYILEGELRQKVASNIRLMKEIKCYKGIRHLRGLPVRGQRTRSNAKTRKGKSLPVGGLKRKLEKT
uniref:Small ribosomal subunit protein uS13 n=1 Tax=candidate division CPR3 bacterium TaxID=2268181 RepID=A0A7C5YVS0_UNCC3